MLMILPVLAAATSKSAGNSQATTTSSTEEKKAVIYPPVTKVNMQAEKKKRQIFVCSRIEATKKIDLLLKAFESSNCLKQNCTLVVAGSVKGE